MLPISGTIKNAVKIAQMDAKWQQKKNTKVELTPEQQQIEIFREDLEKLRENSQYSQIYIKIQKGKKLSPDEEEYLQKNDPQGYTDYKNAQAEKEAFKKKLKNCETKEEVRKLKVTEMGNFLSQAKSISNNPHIPDGKKLELLGRIISRVLGLEEIYRDYVKSSEFVGMKESELLEKVPDKEKKHDQKDDEEVLDTFISEEFAQVELMYSELKNTNVTKDATPSVKCDS